jgi:hypothetical protein
MRVRHRIIGAVTVVAVGIGLAACSSSSTANPPATTGAPAASPSVVLLRAVQSTEQQNSADIGMALRVGIDGKTIGLTGSGSIDLDNNAMQLTLNLKGLPISGLASELGTLSVIYVDGTAYVSNPEISKLAPGKNWIAQPVTKSATSGLQLTNASDMLKILSAKGAVVTKVGPQTIGSTPVTAYDVALSPAVINSRLSSVGISSSDASAVKKIFQDGLTYRVYVGSDNRIRRMSLSIALPAGSGASASHESMVIDFTNYGTPVSITAPPASQVTTLQELEGGQTIG